MQLYKHLREHKKEIVEQLVSYVKTTHPERTVDHYKCIRDLEYIYSAIINDLVNNTSDNIRRISSKFWHKGTRQLQSFHVEFEVYDLLEQKIVKIIDDIYHPMLHCLINNLKDIIENGPDLCYSEQKMQDRRNVVKFNKDISVPQELESIIDNCIENTPVQNHTNFRFLKTTLQDQEIKDFLVKNFFYNDTTNRHMIAVSTSPLVYIATYTDKLSNISNMLVDNDHLQIGIHGGSIMQETLNFGYDFAFIGCGPDLKPIPKSIIKEWRRIMYDRWGVIANKAYPNPLLCFCIGKGSFDTTDENSKYTLDSGFTIAPQIFEPINRKYRPQKLFT